MQTVVTASPEHVACELEDEMVVLSLETGEYYGLDQVSATVWGLIQEPRTIAQLRDALLAEYEGVTKEECELQLVSLLTEMAELRLVQIGKAA